VVSGCRDGAPWGPTTQAALNPLPTPLVSPSQATFQKNFQPLVEWIVRMRERAVAIVGKMEAQSRVSLNVFKACEQLRDPRDYNELTSAMESLPRPTSLAFKTELKRVLENRWWTWVLCHPGLKEVHESRRVLRSSHTPVASPLSPRVVDARAKGGGPGGGEGTRAPVGGHRTMFPNQPPLPSPSLHPQAPSARGRASRRPSATWPTSGC
jgi:hypothetical protein